MKHLEINILSYIQNLKILTFYKLSKAPYKNLQHSWKPEDWAEDGAWLRMFRNARKFIG